MSKKLKVSYPEDRMLEVLYLLIKHHVLTNDKNGDR
jgi:hypothetical protein